VSDATPILELERVRLSYMLRAGEVNVTPDLSLRLELGVPAGQVQVVKLSCAGRNDVNVAGRSALTRSMTACHSRSIGIPDAATTTLRNRRYEMPPWIRIGLRRGNST